MGKGRETQNCAGRPEGKLSACEFQGKTCAQSSFLPSCGRWKEVYSNLPSCFEVWRCEQAPLGASRFQDSLKVKNLGSTTNVNRRDVRGC